MTQSPVTIDVVSDVVCPWCYLGKRRLEKALTLAPEVPTVVRWRPYRLDPTIPPGGIDRKEYIIRKFGSLEAIEPAHERLVAYGKAEGIDYRFERIERSANTIDAHRLIRWAAAAGLQEAMVERLFAAEFTEGKDVGSLRVLAALAGEVGMDTETVGRRLASDEDRAEVIAEVENATRIGVTGVPCFILDGRYAVMGAHPAESLAAAIRDALAKRDATVEA
jgi:predicted DsbA family dithiol-disulfide isomerase